MADADAGAAEPPDLLRIEMDAVREPRALRHPAGLLEQIDRAQPIHFETEALLVLRLAQMSVQLAIVALGESGAVAHQPLVDRERRTRRERDTDLRAGFGIVEQLQHALAVLEDRVLVLHDASGGRPPSFWLRFIEPRVTVMRMPSSRAASTSMSTASSSPGGNK